ncbi:hypothetical protein KBTX_02807 [wastewater metagenome]|uniref:Outer membrane protein beta-barrel domain-containing protein n=2 Tax=unclassified sequences TaxID=12908 RepID=A0A5B8RF37_9ZZZZ|nr:porin family protein [Arhodomonas sp. KWT]QEA06468.1 hypothetical protein KBTEX_02807 [uncultured organism]
MDTSLVKRTTTALAVASALSLASAAHAAGQFDGAYIGGQLGYASYDLDVSGGGDSIEGLSATGARGGLFVGTGMMRNGWYMGFQADAASSSSDTSISTGSDNLKIDAQEEYGIDARLGRQLANGVLLYGIAGWQQTNFELTVNGNSDDDDFNGFRFGVGIDIVAGERLFTRLEYTQAVYDKESYGDTEVDPQAQGFNIGVGYRF